MAVVVVVVVVVQGVILALKTLLATWLAVLGFSYDELEYRPIMCLYCYSCTKSDTSLMGRRP